MLIFNVYVILKSNNLMLLFHYITFHWGHYTKS